MNNPKKLGELLQQLTEYGYEVKETTGTSLQESSAISKETLEKLNSDQTPNFEAFVAWSKSF